MQRVIVTGATSMIGVSLIKELLKNDVVVYAVVRNDCTKLNWLPQSEHLKIIRCNIDQYSLLPSLINNTVDTFYHIAWTATGNNRNNSIYDQTMNILYTMDALEAAHTLKCNKFVGAGSQAEYGIINTGLISPASPCNPIQPYGIAKHAAGKLARAQAEQYGMDCFWVRIFSVYGPHDRKTSVISYVIDCLKHQQVPELTPAQQNWDYLYEEDAGRALYLIGEKSTGNKIYCLGSGDHRTLQQYLEVIRDAIDSNLKIGFGVKEYSKNAVMNLRPDISDLTADTGFKPLVDFESGIINIISNR